MIEFEDGPQGLTKKGEETTRQILIEELTHFEKLAEAVSFSLEKIRIAIKKVLSNERRRREY